MKFASCGGVAIPLVFRFAPLVLKSCMPERFKYAPGVGGLPANVAAMGVDGRPYAGD